MGDMNLIRLIENLMLVGCAITFEHVGNGFFTQVTVTKNNEGETQEVFSKAVGSTELRNSGRLKVLEKDIMVKINELA